MTQIRTHAPVRLLSREQAMLEFNRRVLLQARRADVPLLERLRYICIVSSNMDEFFEVRFADMLDAARESGSGISTQDVLRVAQEAHGLIDEKYAAFNEQVMPALKEQGILVLNHADRNEAQTRWVDTFFKRQVRPLLVPVGLDPAHPFPQVANKSLNFIVKLGGKDAFGRDNSIAIVKVPRVLPRVIRLPAAISEGKQAFVLLSSVIRSHLEELFQGREVVAFSQFRVTRDSDLDVDEEEVANLRQALRTGLTTRHFGRAIRIEVVNSCPPELSNFLLEQFAVPEAALYRRVATYMQRVGKQPKARTQLVAFLRKAVAAFPKSDNYLSSLGKALYESQQCKEAQGIFRDVVTRRPADFEAWNLVAITSLCLEQPDEAREAFRRSLATSS